MLLSRRRDPAFLQIRYMLMTAPDALARDDNRATDLIALAALVAGALAMGISPIFVRDADVGPYTSAFYRVALALPALWLWARIEARTSRAAQADGGWALATVLAGVFFAGDLFFWHLAIMKTSIANATLLATMAPIWVALLSGLVIGEPVTRATFLGLGACIFGALLLVGSNWHGDATHVLGDIFGFATSAFFGFYFLAIRVARRSAPSGVILFRSTLITAVLLAGIALAFERVFLPQSLAGLLSLIGLAGIAHVGGQGLLTFALGTLSAAFSSLVIFLEAAFAAFFAWLLFNESLSILQLSGGCLILVGVFIARPRG